MPGTFNHSSSWRAKSNSHRHPRAGRACVETLEDRRLLSFSPAVNYATAPATPSAIVTADFNNDGKLDLATCANATTGSVSVLLGDGAGGFGAAQRTVVGAYFSSIAVADFNNDTKTDIAVSDGSGFYVFMGNGDGTFQTASSTFAVSGGMAGVGDFNGDDNEDVLVTWLDGDWATHVQVYRGNGQGGFAAASDSSYWGYGGMAAVELNNDGRLDVATGEGLAFLGNGDGSFQFDWQRPAPHSGGAIATGDLTGEGETDLVVVAASGVAVLRGRGDGTFDAPTTYGANGTAHSAVATADFNADGKLDAIVTDADLGTVSVMLGNRDGTFRFAGAFAIGASPSSIAVGDFNRDGRPDVAVSNAGFESKNVSVLLNDGDWQAPLPPPPAPPEVSVGDATVTEGNTGTRNAIFTVTLSKPAADRAEVYFNAGNITAVAGSDFDHTSGVVVFAPGETSKTITVAVRGDRVAEPTETFAVNLVMPTNLRIADAQGIGTITDNEPRVSINDVGRTEGHSGSTTFTFTVWLSAAYDQTVTVDYATANGTATAGTDYTSKAGSLTFAAGETSKTISVVVKGDKQKEANETFFLDLRGVSSNALIADVRGIGTIIDDDRK